jgi:hypothetical protein
VATGIQLVIDCADPERLAAFWTGALGYRLEEPPDGTESWQAYWTARGLPPEEVEDGYYAIVDPEGVRPRIWFQPVPEPKVVKNRLHLDLGVGGGRQVPLATRRQRVDAEAERLTAAGASRLRVLSGEAEGHYAVVMADPEGNEFCLH